MSYKSPVLKSRNLKIYNFFLISYFLSLYLKISVVLEGNDPRGWVCDLFLCPHPKAFRQLLCPHCGEFAHLLKKMQML